VGALDSRQLTDPAAKGTTGSVASPSGSPAPPTDVSAPPCANPTVSVPPASPCGVGAPTRGDPAPLVQVVGSLEIPVAWS